MSGGWPEHFFHPAGCSIHLGTASPVTTGTDCAGTLLSDRGMVCISHVSTCLHSPDCMQLRYLCSPNVQTYTSKHVIRDAGR